MDQEKSKNISEYFKNLPKPVQDLIFDGIWMERTEEVAKKYSLNQAQMESLTDDVLFVLAGLEKPEDFLQTIIEELKISRLLAEQIVEDVESRVFDYAIKTIEGKGDKKPTDKNQEVVIDTNSDIPEIRPEITPMIEPEEKVRVRPIPVGFSGATPKSASVPQPSAPVPSESTPELVQRPVSVPRYTGAQMENSDAKPVPHQSASGPQPSASSPQPVPEPVKKYAVDPYREPIN